MSRLKSARSPLRTCSSNSVTLGRAPSATRQTSVRDVRNARCPRHHDLHLEQFDERLRARAKARLLEQRLLFERLEVEILGEGVDQSVVAQPGWGLVGAP